MKLSLSLPSLIILLISPHNSNHISLSDTNILVATHYLSNDFYYLRKLQILRAFRVLQNFVPVHFVWPLSLSLWDLLFHASASHFPLCSLNSVASNSSHYYCHLELPPTWNLIPKSYLAFMVLLSCHIPCKSIFSSLHLNNFSFWLFVFYMCLFAIQSLKNPVLSPY